MELTYRELEVIINLIEFMQKYHRTTKEEEALLERIKEARD
ncbi:hypothetical protein [Providencia phage PSTCR2]|uniref:Uncharacterized protein n=1 Tax=Providencia phage PSTCR2 TaxID=2783544 RepID=A0A873WWZ0_9CAUD|nr:hypothetical protein [Providencia phage PSTCR2]